MKWVIRSEKEMSNVSRAISPLLKKGDVVALYGTLGVGKTTFVRSLVSELVQKEIDVPSPTFTLVQSYGTPNFELYHFDCYRLKSPEEAYEIGIEEAFYDGVSLIEWPDKIGSLLPRKHKSLFFKLLSDGSREITAEGFE